MVRTFFPGWTLLVLGALFPVIGRFHFFRFGRLPDDILYRRRNFTFYFPIATSSILSFPLTIVCRVLQRR